MSTIDPIDFEYFFKKPKLNLF